MQQLERHLGSVTAVHAVRVRVRNVRVTRAHVHRLPWRQVSATRSYCPLCPRVMPAARCAHVQSHATGGDAAPYTQPGGRAVATNTFTESSMLVCDDDDDECDR
jgi:hypothetical protein